MKIREASAREIKAEIRAQALEAHPDRGTELAALKAEFSALSEAADLTGLHAAGVAAARSLADYLGPTGFLAQLTELVPEALGGDAVALEAVRAIEREIAEGLEERTLNARQSPEQWAERRRAELQDQIHTVSAAQRHRDEVVAVFGGDVEEHQ